MTQLEFFQNALANSVETLLNTEAHVKSSLEWIIESKRLAIEKMVMGNTFNSDDICDFGSWEQAGIPHNAEIKAVAVGSDFSNYDIVGKLKSRDRSWLENLFIIKVVFMRDPETILKSKAKLTDNEKELLKRMCDYYTLKEYKPDVDRLMECNRRLKELKHGYNMAFAYEWYYGFNEVIDSGLLKYGLLVRKMTITKNYREEEDEE